MALREIWAEFTFKWDKGALSSLNAATTKAEAGVRKLATATATVAERAREAATSGAKLKGSLAGWGALAQQNAAATKAAAGVRTLAAAANTLTERAREASTSGARLKGSLAGWGALAQQNGATITDLAHAVRMLRVNVRAAIGGDEKLAAAFRELGADTTKLSAKGRSAASVWTEVTGRLAGVESQAKRSQLALQILGDVGSKVATPALGGGREGLRANLKAASIAAKPAADTAAVAEVAAKTEGRLAKLGAAWRKVFAGGKAPQAVRQIRSLKDVAGEAALALGIFGGAFGAVFGARKLAEVVSGTLEEVDATAKLAKQLGFTAEALQRLQAFAGLGGVKVEELRIGVSTLTRNLGVLAATGKGEAKDALRAMGIEIDSIKGKSPEQLFYEFGKSVASIEDPIKRGAMAQKLFGESGQRLLSAFQGTPEEIDAVRKRVEELGVVFSEDFAKQAEETKDEMLLTGLQFERLKVTLVGYLVPAIRWTSTQLTAFMSRVSEVAKRTNAFKAAFLTGGWALFGKLLSKLLGGVGGLRGALGKFFPWVARLARFLLPWIAWTLILDDIITFLKGGDSALGRLLDALFGVGTSKAVLEWLRDVWKDIRDAIVKTAHKLRDWIQTLDEHDKKIVATVGFVGLLAAAFPGVTAAVLRLGVAVLGQVAAWGKAAAAWTAGQLAAAAASGGVMGLAAALGAVAAAVAAVVVAWQQFSSLLDEVGGWSGLIEGVKSLASTGDFFKGVDAEANAKARRAAASRRAQAVREGRAEPGAGYRGGTGTRVEINDHSTVSVKVATPSNAAKVGRAAAAGAAQGRRSAAAKTNAALVGVPRG